MKEPFMCDLCGMHEAEYEDGWCEDCIEEQEEGIIDSSLNKLQSEGDPTDAINFYKLLR